MKEGFALCRNNAGLIYMKFRLSQDGVEETFAINHLGKSYIILPEMCGVSV
jgi:hypothetical protein